MNGPAAPEIAPRVRPAVRLETAAARWPGRYVAPAIIAGAWLAIMVAQVAGGAAIHHHAGIGGDRPSWAGVPRFLVSWQVMVAAMMLPASLPTIRVVEAEIARKIRPRLELAAFLGAFAIVWAVFGLLALAGSQGLQHAIEMSPWLAAHPWLTDAAIIAVAGGYQLTSWKRRSLAACRHPVDLAASGSPSERSGARLGLRHGLVCLGSSWALMLPMFGETFTNPWWMLTLAGIMVYEATGRHGQRAATAVGSGLLVVALTMVSGPLSAGL